MADGLKDPEKRRRAIKALLIATGPLFVFSYVLAVAQRAASHHALFIAALAAAMSLGTAAIIAIFGPKSPAAFTVVAGIIGLLSFLFGR